jgi:hypothetical protein
MPNSMGGVFTTIAIGENKILTENISLKARSLHLHFLETEGNHFYTNISIRHIWFVYNPNREQTLFFPILTNNKDIVKPTYTQTGFLSTANDVDLIIILYGC